MSGKNEVEELEGVMVDPGSMTVSIHPNEMVIIPVDSEPKAFVEALDNIDGVQAWPLPDNRVLIFRKS